MIWSQNGRNFKVSILTITSLINLRIVRNVLIYQYIAHYTA